MKIRNMESSRGNMVPNQFVLEMDNGDTYFQSYKSMIAKKDKRGRGYIRQSILGLQCDNDEVSRHVPGAQCQGDTEEDKSRTVYSGGA